MAEFPQAAGLNWRPRDLINACAYRACSVMRSVRVPGYPAGWIIGRAAWDLLRYSGQVAEGHSPATVTRSAGLSIGPGLPQLINTQATFTIDRCAVSADGRASIWLPPAYFDFFSRTVRLVEEQSRSWRGLRLDEAIDVVSRSPRERGWVWAPVTTELCLGAKGWARRRTVWVLRCPTFFGP